jgi:hypothetical protein
MTNKKHNFWVLLRLLVKEKGTRILGCPHQLCPALQFQEEKGGTGVLALYREALRRA